MNWDETMRIGGRRRMRHSGFTLIELLVVIAVIGILAAIILATAGGVSEAKQRSTAQALLKQVSLAIDSYQGALGEYPLDNTNDFSRPPLLYELKGTRWIEDGTTRYETLDRAHSILESDMPSTVGVTGFFNSEVPNQDFAAKNFIGEVHPSNVEQDGPAHYLVHPRPRPDGSINPVHYKESSPDRHNLDGYDIWIELFLGNETEIIGNW